jgi:hypothetical protein
MKNYGRFLNMLFPMRNLLVLSIEGDEGGGSDDGTAELDKMFSNEQASSDDGKAGEAPGGGKDVSGGESGTKADVQPSDKEKADVFTDDDLEKALSPVEAPEEKAARLERDYSASSKEAQRLNGEKKAIAKALEDQGLKLVVKDGKADLIPTGKYSADGKPFEVKISKMSAEDQEALESGDLSEIQKVIDKVVDDARNKLVRPAPTREKEPSLISEEKVEAVFNSLAEAKDELDVSKHLNFKENEKHIRSFINNSARPQALRDAFAEAPEVIAALVNSHINAVKEGLRNRAEAVKAANEKKAKEARSSAGRGVEDEGTVSQNGDDDYLNQFGRSRFA